MQDYRRYHIDAKPAPDCAPHPSRFRVKINKKNLAFLLFKELFTYRGNWKVIKSNPCVYGVFAGPVGGFSPKEELCVGCLRCTTEHPHVAQILKNDERDRLGDSYLTPDQYDTIMYEARTGLVPVKGAGYRGKFGGKGWDGMWTDMSEIVRPTRDGIHGREFISTVVDIGGVPPYLRFDPLGGVETIPNSISIPIPMLFDGPLRPLHLIYSKAAKALQTLSMAPLEQVLQGSTRGEHLVPIVGVEDRRYISKLSWKPRMVGMERFDEKLLHQLKTYFPDSIIAVRVKVEEDLLEYYRKGVRVFHLMADFHGRGMNGRFILDTIRESHELFVKEKCRDEVTLIGGGGIVAAEHLAKAILCGLDVVALDTALLAALQVGFVGECSDRNTGRFRVPEQLTAEWGVQRLKNLVNAWRDQLLEVMGAMGIREVRRMRGEVGRAMFQSDYENDAFKGIEGYEVQ